MKNRAMIPAILAVGLFCLVSVSSAQAGLFHHHKAGCDCGCAVAAEPSCGCEAAEPSCGCEADACCTPCRPGLLARLRARCAAKRCCEPTCGCEAEPSCGCEAAEPSCGCEADACCNPCRRPGILARLRARCAAKKCCEPTCGCEAEPSCGCE